MASTESAAIVLPAGGIRVITDRRGRLILITVALAGMLAPLNSTMIAVALPQIIGEFKISVAQAGWLVAAYLITMAALQPVTGRLGDRVGRRRMILLGLAYFGIASAGAALSRNLGELFFFRVQQAVAAAMALPNGTALIREIAPSEHRGRQLGLVGSAVGLAAAAGPALGGVLVGLGGWQAIFTANLIVVLPALAIGWFVLPARSAPSARRSFDVAGAVLLMIILVGLVLLLTSLRGAPSLGWPVIGLLVLAALTAFFLWHEARHAEAVLPPRLFGRRGFSAANGAVATSNLAMYVTLLTVPLMLAGRLGWSAARTGFVLAAMSVALMVASPVGGWLSDRWGRRWPVALGLGILTVALLPPAIQGGDVSLPLLLLSLAIAGIGLGLSSAGMQAAALESAPVALAGVASGVYSTSRYLGSITGTSLMALLLAVGGIGQNFGAVFLLAAVAAGASLLIGLLLPDRPDISRG
jgi:EmrB/QacA subfamily drug resistance transporter